LRELFSRMGRWRIGWSWMGVALLTWLYNSTGGSLLACILWHGSYNAAVAGSGGVIAVVETAVVIGAVIFIGKRYGPESLSSREKQVIA
jgi:hypothetical protein